LKIWQIFICYLLYFENLPDFISNCKKLALSVRNYACATILQSEHFMTQTYPKIEHCRFKIPLQKTPDTTMV